MSVIGDKRNGTFLDTTTGVTINKIYDVYEVIRIYKAV